MHRHDRTLLVLALVLTTTGPARAGVKLITLPDRERVEIQLDHPGSTLVEEERVVPLSQGVNDVVFAWANTSIDVASVRLRCLTDPETVRVLSVSYPPGEAALTWQVYAPRPTSARVRISYIVNGLNKSFTYRAVATGDERTLTLWQHIRLHNRANEAFGTAGMWPGFGERLERPIAANETKRLLIARFDDVPIHKTYTADLAQYGYLDEAQNQLRIPMHYRLRNDVTSGLGRYPLMPGKARIFQDDGQGTVAFIGEDWAPLTPRQSNMLLAIGVAQDVVVKRTIERREREPVMGNLAEIDLVVKYEIENFKDTGVTLDIAEFMPRLRTEAGISPSREVEWTLGNNHTLGALDTKLSSADRPVFHVTLPPRGDDQSAQKLVHRLHVVIKNEW